MPGKQFKSADRITPSEEELSSDKEPSQQESPSKRKAPASDPREGAESKRAGRQEARRVSRPSASSSTSDEEAWNTSSKGDESTSDVGVDASGMEAESEEDASQGAEENERRSPFVQTNNEELKASEHFPTDPPLEGFDKINPVSLRDPAALRAFKPSSLSGKQLWHIIAPTSASLGGLKEVALDDVKKGRPIFSRSGSNYGFLPGIKSERDEAKLLLPNETGESYNIVKLQFDEVFHIQHLVPSTVDSGRGNCTPSVNLARQSLIPPQDLKMRYWPPGFEPRGAFSTAAPPSSGTAPSLSQGNGGQRAAASMTRDVGRRGRTNTALSDDNEPAAGDASQPACGLAETGFSEPGEDESMPLDWQRRRLGDPPSRKPARLANLGSKIQRQEFSGELPRIRSSFPAKSKNKPVSEHGSFASESINFSDDSDTYTRFHPKETKATNSHLKVNRHMSVFARASELGQGWSSEASPSARRFSNSLDPNGHIGKRAPDIEPTTWYSHQAPISAVDLLAKNGPESANQIPSQDSQKSAKKSSHPSNLPQVNGTPSEGQRGGQRHRYKAPRQSSQQRVNDSQSSQKCNAPASQQPTVSEGSQTKNFSFSIQDFAHASGSQKSAKASQGSQDTSETAKLGKPKSKIKAHFADLKESQSSGKRVSPKSSQGTAKKQSMSSGKVHYVDMNGSQSSSKGHSQNSLESHNKERKKKKKGDSNTTSQEDRTARNGW